MTSSFTSTLQEPIALPAAQAAPRGAERLGLLETAATVICGCAIASVPVFSYQEDYSIIPQALAGLSAITALFMLVRKGPRPHPAVSAYVGLVLFFALTLIRHPELWESYQTLIKVCVLALAAHIIVRKPAQVLLVLGIYSGTAVVTLCLNWNELELLRAGTAAHGLTAADDRFAGTLANANTAGVYGIMVMLLALVVHANARTAIRWAILLVGMVSGMALCYYSGSRKAEFGICALCVAMPWLTIRPGRPGGRPWAKRLIFLAMLVPLGIWILINLPHNDRLFAFVTEGAAADTASSTRYEMLLKSLDLWMQSPWFGHGYDGFARLSGFDMSSHTTFGEVLCNAGLVGFVLLGIFYQLPAWELFARVRWQHPGGERTLCSGLLAFWIFFSLFSCFSVMLAARDYIPICAAICGYLKATRHAHNHQLQCQNAR